MNRAMTKVLQLVVLLFSLALASVSGASETVGFSPAGNDKPESNGTGQISRSKSLPQNSAVKITLLSTMVTDFGSREIATLVDVPGRVVEQQ